VERETIINRKIPLEGVLRIHLHSISHLKKSLENIDYLNKLVSQKTKAESFARGVTSTLENLNNATGTLNMINTQTAGLNLSVKILPFGEDSELNSLFTGYLSKIISNTFNPEFEEEYQIPLSLNSKIMDYLQNKNGIFEIRHYFNPKSNETNLLDTFAPTLQRNLNQIDGKILIFWLKIHRRS
jgi:hypothetical protein